MNVCRITRSGIAERRGDAAVRMRVLMPAGELSRLGHATRIVPGYRRPG